MSVDDRSVPPALKAAFGLCLVAAVLMLLAAFAALSDLPRATGTTIRLNLGVVGGVNLLVALIMAAVVPRLRTPGKAGLGARRALALGGAASIAVSVLGLVTQTVGVAILGHVIVLAFAMLALYRPAVSAFLRAAR
ncbi:hypothetical protein [Corynebacterium sp. 21KM1197]|uniref:hypothetical protein n=1 Tax=Corynebacterium sp. 21KM1197 TaxID=2989734 RepID=UPI0029CA7047|nr:hypothetical protein [Corynebacterium sp. 21KM1197]WPF68888.1 hypothetical protein OLW90_01325 [Corynebacterium sp. 21KM1197]